jgi:hypothetical protein
LSGRSLSARDEELRESFHLFKEAKSSVFMINLRYYNEKRGVKEEDAKSLCSLDEKNCAS